MNEREKEVVKENEIKNPDHRTLAEMWDDDRNRVKEIMTAENLYHNKFDDKVTAGLFHVACLPVAVGKLGVPDPANIPKLSIEAVFDQHNIKFEQRKDPAEGWRCGVYIYQKNELAFFVSAIIDAKPDSRLYTPGRYRIVTNVMKA